MNKKLIMGIAVLILIGAGVTWYARQHRTQTPTQKNQFQQNIDKMMGIVNDKNSTKADIEGAWLQIGMNYESLGQRDQELAALLKASEVDPTSYIPWSSLGTLYVETKTYDKAAEAFQKALSLDNSDPQLWLKWIDFNLYQIGTDDKHMRMLFNDAYTATHNSDLLLRQGAGYLQDTGDISGAIAAWQEVLKESPNDATVKATIAALQAKLKK